MKKNMNNTDRLIRLFIAVIVSVLFLTGTISGVYATALLTMVVIFSLTAAIGFCPLYMLCGSNSCRIKKAKTGE